MNNNIDDLLEKIFSNVNNWLNHAENKHIANIAFVIACFAIINDIDKQAILLNAPKILLSVSGIVSLFSFYPRIKEVSDRLKRKFQKNEDDNLIFFEDIKKYYSYEYLEQISKKYYNNEEIEINKYHCDISKEIVYNSEVASIKFKLFKGVVYLDIFAFAFLIVFLIKISFV